MRAWIYAVFLLSGFAALLYQIVWQRALYAIYGINIESVTMVVTAFMLGLGVGSVVGGVVSKDPKRPVLLMFALVELGIGLFGAVSLSVFHVVGEATLGMSAVATFVVTCSCRRCSWAARCRSSSRISFAPARTSARAWARCTS
jgi:predicted membrane-bound spermidine synthase